MSYLTLEAEISQGKIIVREAEKLPEQGVALVTILDTDTMHPKPRRPFGLAKGQFVMPAEFNSPLPAEVLRDFEGE